MFNFPQRLLGSKPDDSSKENSNSQDDFKSQLLTTSIVAIGLLYLVLVPTEAVKKKLEPVDAGILAAIILVNSGVITRVTSLTIGKDGLEAKIEEQVKKYTEKEVEELKTFKEKYEAEQKNNLILLKEVDFHLSGTIENGSDYSRLLDLMKGASPMALECVYQKAKDFRHRITAEKRSAKLNGTVYFRQGEIERAAEIFRALIDSGHREKYHRFYAQLGYALKDQDKKNWPEAEKYLDAAIEYWGKEKPDLEFRPPSHYCFNWLVCLVEISRMNGFKTQYNAADKEKIKGRIQSAVKCRQLRNVLLERGKNEFGETFFQWCENQSSQGNRSYFV